MVCNILNNSFAIVVQFILGLGCLTSLFIKRYFEFPKRKFQVFIYDISKQLIASILAHFLNIIMVLYLINSNNKDECSIYFINFIIDILLGIPLNYLMIKLTNYISRNYNYRFLRIGDYINDNNTLNKSYFIQLGIWIITVFISKTIIFLLILLPFNTQLYIIGDNILKPVKNYEHLELIIVMILVPLLLNLIQYWVQDNFLKGKTNVMNNNHKYDSISPKSKYISDNISENEMGIILHSDYSEL